MATQKFTYTGATKKWKRTGKQYVFNKQNRKWLTAHFKQSYNKGTQPQYKLPSHLRYNPYTNQIQTINRQKKLMSRIQKTAPKFKTNQVVQRGRQAGLVKPSQRQLKKRIKDPERFRQPIKVQDFTNNDVLYKKKRFEYRFNNAFSLRENVRRRLQQTKSSNPNAIYNVILSQGGINKAYTTYRTGNEDMLVDDVSNKYNQYINQYEGNESSSEYIPDTGIRGDAVLPTSITIQRWTPKPNSGNQLIGSGSTNHNNINGDKFIHINIPNVKNCFYSTLAILNSTCSRRSKVEDFDTLLSQIKQGWKPFKKIIQEKASSIKEKFSKVMKKTHKYEINQNYTDECDMTAHVNYNANGVYGSKAKGWDKKICILDCKFNEIKTISPTCPDTMKKDKHDKYLSTLPTYYMMLYKNHYSALIPRDAIEKVGHSFDDWNDELNKVLTVENENINRPIKKNTFQQIPNDTELLNEIKERLRHRNKIAKEWNKQNKGKIPKPVFDYKQINRMIVDEYCSKMKAKNLKPYSYELFNKEYDYKIATYDIEATNNYEAGEFTPLFNVGQDDGISLENETKMPFQSYMIGLSWFEYPQFDVEGEEDTFKSYNEDDVDMTTLRYKGERIYRYERFEGMDCIKQFFDFLTKHADKFNDYTFFAHNGANFDVPILLRENLCVNENWRITKAVELNGGYIGLTIDDGSNKINFKDSLRHLTGSLDSLCKEIDTKHKKKKELFEPNEINLQNWNTQKYLPNLREYLKHDCLSLLDLVDIYSHTLYYSYVPNIQEFNDVQNVKLEEGDNPICGCCSSECRGAIANSEKNKGRWFWACSECKFADNKPKWIRWCDEDEIEKLSEKVQVKITNRVCRINMTDCFTSSSFAKKLLYKHYLPHHSNSRYKIYTLCKREEQSIRKGYFGGRTEAFVLGDTNNMGYDKVFYFDETSKYPAEMCKHRIPYGNPTYVYPTEETNKSYNSVYKFVKQNFGFYKCRIKSTAFSKNYKPLIGYKDPETKRLQFQFYNDWFEIEGLFSHEILTGLEYNLYEFEIIHCIKFQGDHILKNIAKGLFDNKAVAKKKGNSVEAKSNKIVVNSLYGLFGLNTYDRDGISIVDINDIGAYKKMTEPDENGDCKFTKVAVQGNYRFIRSKSDIEVNDVNVAVASSITSYARCSLWEYLFMTELNGGKCLMVDTDSCISTLDFMKTEHYDPVDVKMSSGWCKGKTFRFKRDMVKRFCWDKKGEELGSWKNECEEDLEDEFAKKWCKQHKLDKKSLTKEQKKRMKDHVINCMGLQRRYNRMQKDESYSFDKLIMTGCKQYYLHKRLFDGKYMETKKMKGLRQGEDEDESKFVYETYEDMEKKMNGMPLGLIHFERLINGGKIFQNQEQFKNPLANHLDENNPFSIDIVSNGKKFKQVYTKGKQVVHEGRGIEIQAWNYPEDYSMVNGVMVVDYSKPSIQTNLSTLIPQDY